MRKRNRLILVLLLILLVGIKTEKTKTDDIILNAETIKDERELKGVWVTPVVGSIGNSINSEASFKSTMINILDIMDNYGLNALYFHVRTHNNAFYISDINPKAIYISNINLNNFDAVGWLIEETHKRGIEFHAWMNPYRYSTNSYYTNNMPASNPQSNPALLLQNDPAYILNPAKQEVKNHLFDTILEFIEKYPTIDSIHFDDYFYIDTTAAPTDANSRRAHVDDLISGIHDVLTNFNSENNTHIQFGIAPTGIYKNGNGVVTYDSNGNPVTTGSATSGQQHYESYLYADTVKWATEGWIDYLMPQVYWSRNTQAAPFEDVITWWDKVFKYLDVNLYTGIGVYMADEDNRGYWNTDMFEMDAHLNIVDTLDNVEGYAIFSYVHLLDGYNNVNSNSAKQIRNAYLPSERRNIKVLPEVKSMTPVLPGAVTNINLNNNILSWDSLSNAKFYYIYASEDDLTYSSDEIVGVVGGGLTSFDTTNLNPNYNYGIRALSGTNHLTPIELIETLEVYNITYHLNGGSFLLEGFTSHSLMVEAFFTDFYNYLDLEISLDEFMHGENKTSGFDGTYNNYITDLRDNYDKTINPNGVFINKEEYHHWLPLLEVINDYVGFNPSQTNEFWTDNGTAAIRIKQFFKKENPWKLPGNEVALMVEKIPEELALIDNIKYTYNENTLTFSLPIPVKENEEFIGWYDNIGLWGDAITEIIKGTKGDKIFYARFESSEVYEPELTDLEKVTLAKDNLNIIYSNADSFNNVTSNITLLLNGLYDTVITWSSNKTNIISNNGTVIRQANDEEVILTALITLGEVSLEKTFNLTVKEVDSYTITYNLDGGSFNYLLGSKEEVIIEFLTDLYEYLEVAEPLSDFMHGVGKTEGFDGLWHSDTNYLNKIYAVNVKQNNPNYFLSHPTYQDKWGEFGDFMEWFAKKINSGQSFWGSTYEGRIRLRQYIISDTTGINISIEDMNSFPDIYVNNIPYYEYNIYMPTISLTEPVREGFLFAGWYLENTYETLVTEILTNQEINITLYAKWTPTSFNNLVKTINGASIRTSGPQGLRFYGELDNSVKNNEHGFYLIYGSITPIVLMDLINNDINTYNGKVIYKQEVNGVKGEFNEFSIVLINIPIKGYLDNITAISYVVVDGNIILSETESTRNVSEVASKAYNNGEDVSTIIEELNNNLFTYNIVNNEMFIENTNIYEDNVSNLKDIFFNDWNDKFNTTLNNPSTQTFHNSAKIGALPKDLSDSNIYKFFNDELYNLKWMWLLDFLLEVDNTIHTTSQILAIQSDGTYFNTEYNNDNMYNADHLSYSLYNFFNKTHEVGGFTAIDFTINSKYNKLLDYNNIFIKDINEGNYLIKNSLFKLPTINLTPPLNKVYKYYDGSSYYNVSDYYLINGPITLYMIAV